ncbi:MAG: hypothetical protein AB8B68_04915 [Rickettsiaceae bacterium]
MTLGKLKKVAYSQWHSYLQQASSIKTAQQLLDRFPKIPHKLSYKSSNHSFKKAYETLKEQMYKLYSDKTLSESDFLAIQKQVLIEEKRGIGLILEQATEGKKAMSSKHVQKVAKYYNEFRNSTRDAISTINKETISLLKQRIDVFVESMNLLYSDELNPLLLNLIHHLEYSGVKKINSNGHFLLMDRLNLDVTEIDTQSILSNNVYKLARNFLKVIITHLQSDDLGAPSRQTTLEQIYKLTDGSSQLILHTSSLDIGKHWLESRPSTDNPAYYLQWLTDILIKKSVNLKYGPDCLLYKKDGFSSAEIVVKEALQRMFSFIESVPYSINIKNKMGEVFLNYLFSNDKYIIDNPMIYQVIFDSQQIREQLSLETIDISGKNLLHYYFSHTPSIIVDWYGKQGALPGYFNQIAALFQQKIKEKEGSHQDSTGSTPMHYLALSATKELYESDFDFSPWKDMLMIPNLQNVLGETPLHVSCLRGIDTYYFFQLLTNKLSPIWYKNYKLDLTALSAQGDSVLDLIHKSDDDILKQAISEYMIRAIYGGREDESILNFSGVLQTILPEQLLQIDITNDIFGFLYDITDFNKKIDYTIQISNLLRKLKLETSPVQDVIMEYIAEDEVFDIEAYDTLLSGDGV